MTRKEIINFLHDTYGCKKTAMKTIAGLKECADSVGYVVIKKGVEDFDFWEKGVIIDFTKPLRIHRDLPALSTTKMYNGVPVGIIIDQMNVGLAVFNPDLWCYIMNKKDGDIIHFDEIISLKAYGCKDYENILDWFDEMTYCGFIRETEETIDFYAYPRETIKSQPDRYMVNRKRFAPYNFVK